LRVVQELSLKEGYRRVEADYAEFRSDAAPGDDTIDRDTLFGAMEAYLERRNMQANWGDAQKASDEALVNALAAACPLEPEEKQALLEAPTLTDRAQLLIGLCQLGATGHPGGSAIKH
jgi:Lon protease-like protein